ncbi:MAG: hypothetical protein HN356_03200 [Calditrichaeota bacterium]|nr:hypothetical protein [Calditrichota bacterium]MBT7619151.1 hypothetical protein [Calditrichota bacterium]MBT7789053.1 hypothetical protein [Calditrichota bacterium]
MYEHLNAHIDSLALDHRRGAAEIVEDAALLFRDIARCGEKKHRNCTQLFNRAVRRLAEGQPSMAPVLNLLNRVCIFREESGDNWVEFKVRLQRLVSDWNTRTTQMVNYVQDLPREGETLLTYSNSSTVARMLIACNERFGWPRRVLCGEGRPRQEGVVMAKRLKSAGISVLVYTDAALMSQVAAVDMVWIGGDCLSREGLVNKVGSSALSLLAMIHNVPFISLMTTDKLITPDMLMFFRLLSQNPREIIPDDLVELDVVNEYYETIPLELITNIFTEEGLFLPKELVSTIAYGPISSLFEELAEG